MQYFTQLLLTIMLIFLNTKLKQLFWVFSVERSYLGDAKTGKNISIYIPLKMNISLKWGGRSTF